MNTATASPAAEVQPLTPWSTPRRKQATAFATLVVSGAVSVAVVLVTGVAGIDGWAVTFFGVSLVLAVARNLRVGAKERKDALMKVMITAAAANTAPDANGLYNGCAAPISCGVVVSDWVSITD